jgi:hypothetical protein
VTDEPTDIISELGALDLAFVIDTTSSMGPYIEDAKRHARETAETIAKAGDLHLRVAIIEYRDHPPQDHTFVTRIHDFSDFEHFQREILTLMPEGGGDTPEAVYDGLHDASTRQWRANADHRVILIGDAPPHGHASGALRHGGDGFPDGCPCGLTSGGILEIYSMHNLVLDACAIGGDPATIEEFTELAQGTGGKVFKIDVTRPDLVSASVGATMTAASTDITNSRLVYASYAADSSLSVERVAAMNSISVDMVNSSLEYLNRRGYDPRGGIPKPPDGTS